LSSVGFCFENSFRKIWNVSVLQNGSSNKKHVPFIAENAPNK
jgi:hypothetical protein